MGSEPIIKISALYQSSRLALRRRLEQAWGFGNKLTANYLLYFFQAIRNFITIGQNEAGGFAYWALFSLFPLIVLSIIIAITLLGSTRSNVRLQVSATLNQFLPGGESAVIQDSIQNIIPRRNSSYSILSILGLIFGANRLFTHLQWSMSRIFRDDARRPWHLQIIIGTGMMTTLAVLVILSLGLTALFRLVSGQIAGRRSPLIEFGGVLALLLINTVMLTLLYRFTPRRKIAWAAILPAAIVGAVAWEVSRAVFDSYITDLANLGLVYGSLGALIGLLIWMFLIGSIISLCAEIAVATDDWLAARAPSVAVEQLIPNIPVDELSPEDRKEFAVGEPSETAT